MYKNIKWLRLTPDRPGRGGTKTGIHSFQQQPVNDTYAISGCHVYQGAWRRDFDSATEPTAAAVEANSQAPKALHGYVYPSLTDPAAQPSVTVLSHHDNLGGTATHIWDQTAGVIRATHPQTNQPAIFQNIAGRCFVGDGSAEGLILDDRTPAIHAQKNQLLGIGTPSQPLPNTVAFSNLGANTVPYGTAYLYFGSSYINSPNPNNPLGTVLSTDTLLQASVISPNTTTPTGGLGAGLSGVPLANAVTSNTAPFTTPGTGISITTGTSLVTLVGGVWPAGSQFCGLSINFNGFSFVVSTHGANISDFDLDGNGISTSNTQLIIMGVYNGPTLVNVPYTITGCQVQLAGLPTSSLKAVNTSAGATPPGFAFGYSQMTASNLVQVRTFCERSNGQFRNLGNISLGPAGGGTKNTVTDAHMAATADKLNIVTSPSRPFVSTDIGKTMVVDLAGAGGTMLVSTITTFNAPNSVTLADPNGSGGIVTNKRAFWAFGLITIADATMGAVSTTLTSASNPFVVGDVGKTIMVAGAGAAGIALFSTILTFVNAGQVTLVNPSVGAVAGVQAVYGSGLVGVTTGPTYAYAWYDPETGHMSNISPLYQVPAPTVATFVNSLYSDFANLSIVFQVDPGSISYPDQPTDGIRFSHIVFFRTLSTPGSSTLYPIGSLQPFVGKVHPGGASTRGSWNPGTLQGWMGVPSNYLNEPFLAPNTAPNYWYDFSSDSDLILTGGFQAPQFTNSKPMVTLRGGVQQPGKPYLEAYWDRRLWIVNTQEPDKLVFSCDDAQSPLGIPEESFPPTNFLRMTSVDGRGIGLRTVGDMLLLTTERWAYIVAGNNESNYRLMKASAAMPGVGTYQMDEFPTYSGAEGEPSTLFYLGRDRKVYQWTVGGQVVPISQPIQNIPDTALSQGSSSLGVYQLSRVHCVSAWGRRLVVVEPQGYAGVLIYDIDNQVWSLSQATDASGVNPNVPVQMTTVYGLGIPVNELYSVFTASGVVVRSWVRDDTTTSTPPMSLSTFPMNFDGKKNRKTLVAVNIHATSGTYTLQVTPNESLTLTTPQSTFAAYPDPLDSVYGDTPAPVDGVGCQDSVVPEAQFYSIDGKPLVAYRFESFINRFDTLPCRIFAIDFGYVDSEEQGEGDA